MVQTSTHRARHATPPTSLGLVFAVIHPRLAPMSPLKVCFWTTAFQADTQSLAYALAAREDFRVLVATDQPERYRGEVIGEVRPFNGQLLKRNRFWAPLAVKGFSPDVLVIDNQVPAFRLAPRLFVLWHGFGWRHDDISKMRVSLANVIGDVTEPNLNFIWQAFGVWDREYTIEHRGIHAQNVRALGSAFSDDLLASSPIRARFNAEAVQKAYRIDIVNKPTVLIGLTWHHRGAFGNWGEESQLLARLFDHLKQRGANALVRMHDRKRYSHDYLACVQSAAGERDHVQLKFKDESMDSWVDLMVSAALITNYSSLANAFYYTGKPTIHIDTSGTPDDYIYRRLVRGKVVEEQASNPAGVWKLAPQEHGGLRARSFDELIAHVDEALDHPTSCREKADHFVGRYITGVDGHTCERIARMLIDWRSSPSSR
jgi:hypothetical protein